ncbi:erythrocyte membrane protein 1, PfEMP1, putative [Plasmodium gaboni]|uniref:Erythrocyte membrane protein 1, PfEMP1, putative n=1 Tax=Plasmodium gaboni TaxID=647221 RepID=A0ABY0KWH3_9APIC|nr:erythrocyte membrane protein 1, PfEMP1, putative [Plasmodium gaboni]
MGNEISGRQTVVKNKYGVDVYSKTKWYHGEYINFLKQEIEEKTWENKYQSAMKDDNDKPISELGKKFCKWKDIQKEIFEAVLDNHRFLLYTWEEYAKGLVDEAQIKVAARETCEQDKEKNKIKDEDSSGDTRITGSSTGKTIDLGICLPNRRKDINTRLRTIRKNIQDIKNQTHGTESVKAQSAATIVIGNLANQTENEIDNLKKENRSNTDNVCKLYRRTYADYKDISKGKDIVSENVSNEVRTLLKQITSELGRKEKEMNELWEKYFKKTIEKKLNELESSKKDSKTVKSCTLDHSDETTPQCLRYMEEWFENFLEEKRTIANRMEGICTEKIKPINIPGIKNESLCKQYCNHYKEFVEGRKTCYQTYKTKCEENLKTDSTYGKEEVYKAEIQKIERLIKEKSGCEKCEKKGNIDLDKIFDLTDSDTNKSYYCQCNGKKNKDQAPCKDQKQKSPMVLKGNWQQGIHSSQQTKPNAVCQLDYSKHNADGRGEDPCLGIPGGNEWKCDDTFEKGICIPPRRHGICISNIRHLEYGDISGMNSNKLLLELMLAAKEQSHRLRQHNRGVTTVCDAIKSSFLDFGDIIKGTDKANDNNSKDVEKNLRDIFENIRNEWKKNGDRKYDDTTAAVDGLGELRKDWWDANKNTIWDAFNCDGTTKKTCGSMPSDDRSQFLRWLDEWTTEFCDKKSRMQQLVAGACRHCGNNECTQNFWSWPLFSSPDSICDCKYKCKDYSEWIHKKKTEFDKQKNYYDTKITSIDFGNSGGNHNTTTKSSVSKYLKEKANNCGNVNFDDVPKVFSSYPDESHYRHKCSRCYAQLEADLAPKGEKKDNNIKDTCSDSGSGDICKETITDNNNDKDISSHEYYDNNRMLLSELVLVGKSEQKRLQHKYGGNNSDLCTAMRRSFADIGDIVRGTNIVDRDGDGDYYIGSDYYGGKDDDGLILFRKNWWERNRHFILEGFNCGNKCDSHMDMDRVPQLLRWVEEWGEQFHEQREKKIKELNNACISCNMKSSDPKQQNNSQCYPKNTCETCKEKCNDYKTWIENWKTQWDNFKTYYQQKNTEFKEYVTNKDLFDYMVTKLKGRGYNNINRLYENGIFEDYPNGYQNVCNCDYNTTSSSSPSGTKNENNCHDNYKSEWNCNVTRGSTKMCLKNGSDSGNMDDDTLFFNSFTNWIDELYYNLNENRHTLSQNM